MRRAEILIHHQSVDVYECRGCGQLIEVPTAAVLGTGGRWESVKSNPENRLDWLERRRQAHECCWLLLQTPGANVLMMPGTTARQVTIH